MLFHRRPLRTAAFTCALLGPLHGDACDASESQHEIEREREMRFIAFLHLPFLFSFFLIAMAFNLRGVPCDQSSTTITWSKGISRGSRGFVTTVAEEYSI